MSKVQKITTLLKGKWLLVAYVILILITLPYDLAIRAKFLYLLYALFLFIVFLIVLNNPKTIKPDLSSAGNNRFFLWLIILSSLVVLLTRLLPFLRFGEAPLGYDTGFYHERSTMPGVLAETEPFYFILAALQTFGIETIWAINILCIVAQFLLPGSLYLIFRSLKVKHNFVFAAVAFFICAVSATQFHAFWSMFPQQILSISFLFATVALILRQSPAAILSGYLGAALNTPTFALFLLTLIIFLIVICVLKFYKRLHYDHQFLLYSLLGYAVVYLVLVVLFEEFSAAPSEAYHLYLDRLLGGIGWFILLPIAILLFQLFWRKRIISYKILLFVISVFAMWNFFYLTHHTGELDEINTTISFITEYHGLASNYPFWRIPEIKGLFINVSTFRMINLLFIPFVILGFCLPRLWEHDADEESLVSRWLMFLYIMFLLLLVFVTFPFIYQNRFLIVFDIVFILVMTPPLARLLFDFGRSRGGQILIILFFLIFSAKIVAQAWRQQPMLPVNEYQEIKTLASLVEPRARLLATNSNDTPWVMGFSKLIAFGPGYGGDTWSMDEWIEFWRGDSDERRLKLMNDSGYSNYPFYFYIGGREPIDWPYQKFIRNSGHFEQTSEHVWKYLPSL